MEGGKVVFCKCLNMVANDYILFKLIPDIKVKSWQFYPTVGYLPLHLPIPFVYQIDTDTDTNFNICIKRIPILIPIVVI